MADSSGLAGVLYNEACSFVFTYLREKGYYTAVAVEQLQVCADSIQTLVTQMMLTGAVEDADGRARLLKQVVGSWLDLYYTQHPLGDPPESPETFPPLPDDPSVLPTPPLPPPE